MELLDLYPLLGFAYVGMVCGGLLGLAVFYVMLVVGMMYCVCVAAAWNCWSCIRCMVSRMVAWFYLLHGVPIFLHVMWRALLVSHSEFSCFW